MQFSAWLNVAHPPSEVLELARWVDGAGWHGIWVADHYMPNTGNEQVDPGPTHECWSMLAALAVATSTVRIGPLVAPTSVHHPALLANRAATIDHLAGGRMVLGLGAGWQINEHRAYGIELEPPGRRVDRFDEAIQIARSLLSEDRTNFDGDVFTVVDAPAEPKPIQEHLPILVGSSGKRMLRIIARHADEWNTWGAPEQAAERLAAFRAACESEGVDPASKRTTAQALIVVTDDDAVKERSRNGPMGERTIAGSTAEVTDQLGRYVELGFDEFIVPDFTFRGPVSARQEGLAAVQSDVIAQL